MKRTTTSKQILIKNLSLIKNKSELQNIKEGKVLINTINAYSYNVAQRDPLFAKALTEGDYLIPDGMSIVKAYKFLNRNGSKKRKRVAGWDLFAYEMARLNEEAENDQAYWKTMNPERERPVVMFMGSSEKVLSLIVKKAAQTYPNLKIVTYSPPFKAEFSEADNAAIISAINEANPDLLWIGMTAPKQEKWTYSHWNELNIHCHVGTIGAVFDFFAGTSKRAPVWMQNCGMEWFFRLVHEPRRMWRRYIIGNTEFLMLVAHERWANR